MVEVTPIKEMSHEDWLKLRKQESAVRMLQPSVA